MENEDRPYRHISEVASSAYKERMQVAAGEIHYISTGFRALDEIIYGYGKSSMIIIAARPSMGKSAFALTSAISVAKSGIPVGIFSLEMSSEQLALRGVSLTHDIPMHNLMRMDSEVQNSRMLPAFMDIAELPIFLDDTPGLNMAGFEEKFSDMISSHEVGIAFIDYMQLLDERSTRSREQEISKISRMCKRIAKNYSVPVVALAQLNREVDKRPDKKPMLADLRESGSLEQDADIVLLIYNPAKCGIETYEDGRGTQGTAEIIVAKHRHGDLGTARLGFDGQYTKFYDLGYRELVSPAYEDAF